MVITQVTHKTKCDFVGCKNMAEIIIQSQTDLKKKMCFCRECLEALYKAYAKNTTPSGIEAPFKRQKKINR